MNAANIEFDDYETTRKTSTRSFQQRNMLKCQIVFKKNMNLIDYLLEKKEAHRHFFEKYSCKLKRGLLLEIKPIGLPLEVLLYCKFLVRL